MTAELIAFEAKKSCAGLLIPKAQVGAGIKTDCEAAILYVRKLLAQKLRKQDLVFAKLGLKEPSTWYLLKFSQKNEKFH